MFVLIQSDSPPEHARDRRSQIDLWGRMTRDLITAGRNVLLDCDLQTKEEAENLMRIAQLDPGGPDVLLVRLGVSLRSAIDRKGSLPGRDVVQYWTSWGAPPIQWEYRIETDGLAADVVRGRVLEAVRKKWP